MDSNLVLQRKVWALEKRHQENRNSIVTFLEREDNSTCLPGKRDALKLDKEKSQKDVLNDNLDVLHKKYTQEHLDNRVSFAVFCKARPKNILPVSYASRKVCLCQRHQNFALKLRALKSDGFRQHPDTFVRNTTNEQAAEMLKNVSRD